MAYDILLKEAKDLPEDMIKQAIELEKKQKEHFTDHGLPFHRSVNPLANDFIAIADDFDETPECFKEYL